MFVESDPTCSISSGSSRISGWAADACPAIKSVLLPNFSLKQAYRDSGKGEIGSTNA